MTRPGSPLRDGAGSRIAGRIASAVWLGIVSPTWPWGYVRLVGAGLMVEGLFLLVIAPDGTVQRLGVLSALVGAVLFVVSFAPSALDDDERHDRVR